MGSFQEIVPCVCGCGVTFPRRDNKGRVRRFVSGHNGGGTYGQRRMPDAIKWNCGVCNVEMWITREKFFQRNFRVLVCSDKCRQELATRGSRTPESRERKRQLALKNGNIPPHPSGSEHPRWRGGLTPKNQQWRAKKVCADWRKAVYVRDSFTCQDCGQIGGQLHAHHKHESSKFPEERLKLDNGITLCVACHSRIHGRLLGDKWQSKRETLSVLKEVA
jgi:5-methylcytosine-specific restriction endonuclease McrA